MKKPILLIPVYFASLCAHATPGEGYTAKWEKMTGPQYTIETDISECGEQMHTFHRFTVVGAEATGSSRIKVPYMTHYSQHGTDYSKVAEINVGKSFTSTIVDTSADSVVLDYRLQSTWLTGSKEQTTTLTSGKKYTYTVPTSDGVDVSKKGVELPLNEAWRVNVEGCALTLKITKNAS